MGDGKLESYTVMLQLMPFSHIITEQNKNVLSEKFPFKYSGKPSIVAIEATKSF